MQGRSVGREKRQQVRARRDHKCYICGEKISKGQEYIKYSREVTIGYGWEEYKRHIHCDALLRFYSEKMGIDAGNVTNQEMQCFVDYICDTECMQDYRIQCGNNGFSCGEVLYILRSRPGYSAVKASAEACRRDD